jgi:hypothetical protein
VIEKPGFTLASPACTESVDGPEADTFFIEGSGIIVVGSIMEATTDQFIGIVFGDNALPVCIRRKLILCIT